MTNGKWKMENDNASEFLRQCLRLVLTVARPLPRPIYLQSVSTSRKKFSVARDVL